MADTDIYSLVKKAENDYILGNTKTSKYVYEKFYEDISTIEAYLNSRHISGDTDSLGRDKPFFNIVLAARNIWFRCTDLDRKNIVAKARKAKDAIASFLFTTHLKQWMRDAKFGQYLNDWGLYLASYNSAVTKLVENSEGLHINVIPWQKLIVDVLGFDKNPKIEILEMTQDELRGHTEYNQEMVDNLIQAQVTRKTIDRQPKDTKPNYVRLYEVHGQLPLSWLTGREGDKNKYVQQMHVISYVAGKKESDEKQFTLYSGKEKKDPYRLCQMVPAVDGSISLMGAVKTLFDAQWMTNHTIKNIKDQLDLASKTIYQTADPTFANQNMLENIETGQIMVWDKNIPNGQLTQVNSTPADIGALEGFMNQWKELSQDVTNTPNVMSGMASSNVGAYRKELLMIQQSQANFDIMVQNKGLFIEEVMRDFITPYIINKCLNHADEIAAELGEYGIDKIDKKYISNESAKRFNAKAIDAVINGSQLPDLAQEQQGVQSELQDMGNQRFLKPSDISDVMWSDIFEDFEADIEYQITDENGDQQTILSSLNNLLQTIMNPAGMAALQTPQGKLIFNSILDQLGIISSVEFDQLPAPQMPQMQPGGQAQSPGANPQVGGGQPYAQIANNLKK